VLSDFGKLVDAMVATIAVQQKMDQAFLSIESASE
jgi:hypothetical protein